MRSWWCARRRGRNGAWCWGARLRRGGGTAGGRRGEGRRVSRDGGPARRGREGRAGAGRGLGGLTGPRQRGAGWVVPGGVEPAGGEGPVVLVMNPAGAAGGCEKQLAEQGSCRSRGRRSGVCRSRGCGSTRRRAA